MFHYICTMILSLSLCFFIYTTDCFANVESLEGHMGSASGSELTNIHTEHAPKGLKRNLSFSNYFDGWATPWQHYEHSEDSSPRVSLLRIIPGFFSRELRANYLYSNDEHHGDADVSEWRLALELPLTLRIKFDVEMELLHVNTDDGDDTFGFGDTKLALRTMLMENERISLSTGSTVNIITGDEDRHLGKEITTVGQELAFWLDIGRRISFQAFLGVEVPTGGEHREDANVDFLFGAALAKTITIRETPVLEAITPFIELNGVRGYGLEKGEEYKIDLLPGVRWELSNNWYVLQGYEFPLNGAEEFDKRIWFGIIKDF
ncbi:MAG: hypothetical protein E3K37_11975 [Candidatus Kuenenia sp.]|nr:hypothetical protein [Candidatus Kuenenia hertensis]